MKVRIKFRKQGSMKFIGHLDIMRYFQKVMRRADVNIRYSEGFSPHQIMSFAAPLGVGLTSNGEYLDIETEDGKCLGSCYDSKSMTDRLNQVMAEDIEVISCRKLQDSSKNAMSIVCAADYTLKFRQEYQPKDLNEFFERLTDFYSQEHIPIIKKTKKGQKEMDLKSLIYQLRRDRNGIFMQVSAGSTENIKPELVMEAFYQKQQWEYPKFAFQIQREEVYGWDDKSGKMIPLQEFGEDFE